MPIQKTTNYDMFKKIKGNRVLNPTHLANLTVSISRKNMLEYNPIMVNDRMEVIDGQHRLEVAKNNHLPIWYMIVPRTGIDEVVELNAYARTWKLVDYIDSLVARGYPEMVYLKEFCESYGMSVTIAIMAHFGHKHDVGSSKNRFALAKMQFPDELREIGKKTGDLWSVVREYTKKKGVLPRSVVMACRRVVLEGKDLELAKAIQRNGKIIAVSPVTQEMYVILMAQRSRLD